MISQLKDYRAHQAVSIGTEINSRS